MAIAFIVIGSLYFFQKKHNAVLHSLVVSCLFFISELVFPILLKPLYIIWMWLAFILSWINTRIILVILFYSVFTPLGLVMRLLRIDLLERKKSNTTYWKKKEKIDFNISNYKMRF
jgi:hypothetical protein